MVWNNRCHKKAPQLIILLGGTILTQVKSYTYLGVILDQHLSYEAHIKNLCKKVNRRVFQLTKARPFLTINAAITTYRSMILSLMDYASFAYTGANKGLLTKLQRIQNRALKVCLNRFGDRISNNDLHNQAGILPLERRWQELLLSFMYSLSQKGKFKDRERDRFTRSLERYNFIDRAHRTEFYKRNPIYRGAKLWDNLDKSHQKLESKASFKFHVKRIENLLTKQY